jgi:fibronectin type 3 domain-containing protein
MTNKTRCTIVPHGKKKQFEVPLERLTVCKVAVLMALLALQGVAHATLTAYEPFNYGSIANGTATTGSGFTGNWTCGGAGTVASGLTYPSLPTANSSLQSGSSRQFESFASPLSSGTKYISFLFKASGNMGGNIDGVFFPNGNSTCLWFGFGLGPFSGTQGQLGVGSMTTAGTAAQGATSLKQIGLGTYGSTYLIVLKIDFDTSGANDTVTIYTNAPANASSPGATAAGTNTTYDVGTISGVGLNVQGGANITVDEIRVGDTYGDVVGFVPPPAAPTGLAATPGVNSVSLSWDVTSGASGYRVLRGTSTGVYTVTNNVASNTNFDATVVGGTPYFYVVQATNSSGASANSSEVSATPTIALPGTPTSLTAVGTNGAVNLSWSPASGAASYNIKRSTTTGTETTIANAGTTSYSDTAVVNGTTYFYTVSATNTAGESANSSEVSATPNLPPAAPSGVTATAGSNQVSLSWSGSAGAISYNIKRSTTSGSGYAVIGTATAPAVAYTDSSATKFTQYFYVVSAVNGYGESADSSPEATATPTGAYGPSAYEGFNYALGNFTNNTPTTASGFTGNWTVSAFPTIVACLSYSNLPSAANAYRHAAAGSQTTVNFASPLSSGTKYISYLFKGSGNSGGDTVGVFFKGNNASSLFAGFRVPDTGVTTGFGLGTVNSTTLGGAASLGSVVNISNSITHLIVLKIDFNTSGANDTVSLWIDPPAGVIAPAAAANVVNSTFDVGTISAFGINITGGYNPVIDEIRVGDVYGDVVGYGTVAAPTVSTTVAISVAQGEQVSWSAFATNSYQPQKSFDNASWTSVGGLLAGNAVTSVYETSPAPYYRVQEFIPGGAGPDVMVNGSFESSAANNVGAANWNGPASNGNGNQYVTNQYDVLTPTDGSEMLFMEGQGGSGSLVASDLFPISGGVTYKVVFDAANAVKSGGGNPQFRVQFFDAGNAFISESGFISFASAGSSWSVISNNYAAPANAAKMIIGFLQAVGAGPSDHWISLVDNVRVSALATVGGVNVLTPTLQLGASFTGTVQTNGVTATAASGTISFQTNSTQLSVNTLAAGGANSATAILTPPYTVTAIYSGDSLYIGSTNTLTVSNATATVALGNLNQAYDGTAKSATATTTPAGLTVVFTYDGSSAPPTNVGTYVVVGTVVDPVYVGSATNNLVISNSVSSTPAELASTISGNQLTLSWPADHTGWIVQSQTNSTGLSSTWFDVSGSSSTNQMIFTIDPANPTVFFRLKYVP